MGFIVAFLVVIAFIGGLLYVLVIQREVPGAVEQRFGKLEALPDDVGRWSVDLTSLEGAAARSRGLTREVRLFHSPAGGKLVRQVRYRDATSAIVRVEPDEIVRRRRVRQG